MRFVWRSRGPSARDATSGIATGYGINGMERTAPLVQPAHPEGPRFEVEPVPSVPCGDHRPETDLPQRVRVNIPPVDQLPEEKQTGAPDPEPAVRSSPCGSSPSAPAAPGARSGHCRRQMRPPTAVGWCRICRSCGQPRHNSPRPLACKHDHPTLPRRCQQCVPCRLHRCHESRFPALKGRWPMRPEADSCQQRWADCRQHRARWLMPSYPSPSCWPKRDCRTWEARIPAASDALAWWTGWTAGYADLDKCPSTRTVWSAARVISTT